MENLIKQFIQEYRVQEAFVDSLPASIATAFFDNEFVNSLQGMLDKAMSAAIGEDKLDCIFRYLGDSNTTKYIIDTNGVVAFNTDEDFIKWLVTQ